MTEFVSKKPIIVHKGTLYVLETREPAYDKIEALEFPFSISPDGGTRTDSQVMPKYVPLLTGIPCPSAAQTVKLGVFKTGMITTRFFTDLETEETSGGDPTMSHGSGN